MRGRRRVRRPCPAQARYQRRAREFRELPPPGRRATEALPHQWGSATRGTRGTGLSSPAGCTECTRSGTPTVTPVRRRRNACAPRAGAATSRALLVANVRSRCGRAATPTGASARTPSCRRSLWNGTRSGRACPPPRRAEGSLQANAPAAKRCRTRAPASSTRRPRKGDAHAEARCSRRVALVVGGAGCAGEGTRTALRAATLQTSPMLDRAARPAVTMPVVRRCEWLTRRGAVGPGRVPGAHLEAATHPVLRARGDPPEEASRCSDPP